MNRLIMLLMLAFAVTLSLAAIRMPDPDQGCTATWNDAPGYIVVACLQGGCGANTPCTLYVEVDQATLASTAWCKCDGVGDSPTNMKCRGNFTWVGAVTRDSNGIAIKPDDWTCEKIQCGSTCQKLTAVDHAVPVGLDTPCKCP